MAWPPVKSHRQFKMSAKSLHNSNDLLSQLGSDLQEHVGLKDITELGVGGVADYFIRVRTLDQLLKAIRVASHCQLPWTVIGSGTQTVVSDYGYVGLVIKNDANHFEFIPETAQAIVESGARWRTLMVAAAGLGLAGPDGLTLLTGTIGGSIKQGRVCNYANPRTIARKLTIYDAKTREIIQTGPDILTKSAKDAVILVATLQFSHSRLDEIMRRVSAAAKLNSRFTESGRRFLGPIFGSDLTEFDENYLILPFRKAEVLGLKVGGAIFSEDRPNYIEGVGRVTAHNVRELITLAYDRLSQVVASPLSVQIDFVGNWPNEDTSI